MDILNFISWIAGKKRVVTTAPSDSLLPVGIRTPKRDDNYTTVAMTLPDAVHSGCVANNTLYTGIFDQYPYPITPYLNKTCTRVVDTPAVPTFLAINLQGWKVEGSIQLVGAVSYSEYLGTIIIKNYNGTPYLPYNSTGTVSYETSLSGVVGFEPLGLFNGATIGGFGDYAQFGLATATSTVGTDLLIDISLYASPAPMTTSIGDLEAVVSFKLEWLIDEKLDVEFSFTL